MSSDRENASSNGYRKRTLAMMLVLFMVTMTLMPMLTMSAIAEPVNEEPLTFDKLSDYTEAPSGTNQDTPVILEAPPNPEPFALVFYAGRPAFDAAFPGLPVEDFEAATIGPGNVDGIDAPLDDTTNNAYFNPGDILPGIQFQDNPGPDGVGLALLGAGFAGNPSINIVANTFVDSFDIIFTATDVYAVGMDLVSYWNPETCNIEVFGPGAVSLGTTTAASTNAGSFWGVNSNTPGEYITRINIYSPNDEAEGVDNIAFGAGLPLVDLQPPYQQDFCSFLGEQIDYPLTLTNNGANPDTYDLSASGNAWPVDFFMGGMETPLLNPSFETGDFTSWNTQDLGMPFWPLQVAGAGNCPGFGFFTSAPTDGAFSAQHGFDGDGPGNILLGQDYAVPLGVPALVFDYRAAWDLIMIPATIDRTFSVHIEPAGGGAPLQTDLILTATANTFNADTGILQGVVDLSPFTGSTIYIDFDWWVPEWNSGPAFFELDNVQIVNLGAPITQIGPIPAGGTESFIARVTVPGGAAPGDFDLADIIATSQNSFTEDFEGAFPPAGWTVIDPDGIGGWHQAVPSWGGFCAEAMLVMFYASDEWLVSPPVDLSPYVNTHLSLDYRWWSDWSGAWSEGRVYGSIDGGATWPINIYTFPNNSPDTTGSMNWDISAWADGQPNVAFGFHYVSNTDDWFWQIDNVLVESSSEPVQIKTIWPYETPWTDDMESGTGPWSEWNSGGGTAWELGNPAGGVGPASAFSPTNCWGTNLLTDYTLPSEAFLTTPYITLGAGTQVLRFSHWYDIDWSNEDGGWVEISNDNGVTWTQIFPVGGYNDWTGDTPSGYPGWVECYAGTSNTWLPAEFDISAYSGQIVNLRFRFFTEQWVEGGYPGWYIDNVYVGERIYGVDITPDYQTQTDYWTADVDYVLTVDNTGTLADTYDLAAVGNTWPTAFWDITGTVPIASTGVIPPGGTMDFITRVTVPFAVIEGSSDFPTIHATSQADPLFTWDLAQVETFALNPFGVSLTPNYQTQADYWTADVDYVLTVDNIGIWPDNYDLSVACVWPTTFWNLAGTTEIFSTGNILPGGTFDFIARVTIPWGVADGSSDLATIWATSQNDPVWTIDWAQVETFAMNPFGVQLTPDVQGQTGDTGSYVDYVLQVDNTGVWDDTYDITVAGNAWQVTFWDITGTTQIFSIFVPAGGTEFFIARVWITAGLPPGSFDSATIWVTSQNDPVWTMDDAVINTNGEPQYWFGATPLTQTRFGWRGDYVDHYITIHNTGTQEDVYLPMFGDFEWRVKFWNLDRYGNKDEETWWIGPVAPGDTIDFIAEVRMPSVSLGDFDQVTITITSSNNPTVTNNVDIITRTSLPMPYYNDFESGVFGQGVTPNSDWTTNTPGGAGVNTWTSYSGSNSMWICGQGTEITSAMMHTGMNDPCLVSYWVQRGDDGFSEDPDSGEDLVVEYYNDRFTWVELERYPGFGPPGGEFYPVHQLPSDGLHPRFQLRFRQLDGEPGADYWHIDDVYVGPPDPNFDLVPDSSQQWTGLGGVTVYDMQIQNNAIPPGYHSDYYQVNAQGDWPATVRWVEDFNDGNYNGWRVVDEGIHSAPSNWHVSGGHLVQDSNIYWANGQAWSGTYMYTGYMGWTDYTLSTRWKSADNDGVGIMGRYTDPYNYYRFHWSADWDKDVTKPNIQRRVLDFCHNGEWTVLASDGVSYTPHQWYNVDMRFNGENIQVYIDGSLIFDVEDYSLDHGAIALYNWGEGNPRCTFDAVMVYNNAPSCSSSLIMGPVPPGDSINFQVVVEVPGTASIGDSGTHTVTTNSVFTPWPTDTSTLTTGIGSVHNLDLDTWHPTIQNGIDMADPGNELFVYSGVYHENVVVDKPLMLIGQDRDTTIVEPGLDVLLLHADDGAGEPIRGQLQALGINTVDESYAGSSTPSLAQLQNYDVVLAWSNYQYWDPVAIGDVLADYVDSGGRVITMMFTMGTSGWQIEGRFRDEGYHAMDGISNLYGWSTLGPYDASHPITNGVSTVDEYYRLSGTYLTPGSQEIASWDDGEIFVAAKNDRSVVSIGGYVGFYRMWTGQMDQVVYNSLLWQTEGQPKSGSVFHVLADNVYLSGFTIQNSDTGVLLDGASGCWVGENTFTTNNGIDSRCSGDNMIVLNEITSPDTFTTGSLETMFAQNNGLDGNMFDVTATNELTITGFDINMDPGTDNVEVYYKSGTYVGAEADPMQWTLLGVTSVTSNGADVPTYVPIGGLTLPPGQTYGLYVTTLGNGVGYTNGVNSYSNADLTFNSGVGVAYPFAGFAFPRTWNGRIYYNLGDSAGGTGIQVFGSGFDTDFQDDFSTDTGSWTYFGNAQRTNDYLQLTANSNGQLGQIWYDTGITSDFVCDFDYYIGGGNDADGMVFMFYKDTAYAPSGGGELGFDDGGPVQGYGIEFDHYLNGGWDIDDRHIALVEDQISNHLAQVYDTRVRDGSWHHARVMVSGSTIFAFVDDMSTPVLSWSGTIDTTFGGMGFSAATGGQNDYHLVDNVEISWGTPLTENIIAANDIQDYSHGVTLEWSQENIVAYNNFIDNTRQAFDGMSNTWDTGYPDGGNYWSDHTGPDAFSGPLQNIPGGDGIVDDPYVLDGDSQDNYPLTHFWTMTTPLVAYNVICGSQTSGQVTGLPINYIVTVYNTGTTHDIYDIAVSGNAWDTSIWDSSITSQITSLGPVAPGEITSFVVQVMVPVDAIQDALDTLDISIVSQCNNSLVENLIFVTKAIVDTTLPAGGGMIEPVVEEEILPDDMSEEMVEQVEETPTEMAEEPLPISQEPVAEEPVEEITEEPVQSTPASETKEIGHWTWLLFPAFFIVVLLPSAYHHKKRKQKW